MYCMLNASIMPNFFSLIQMRDFALQTKSKSIGDDIFTASGSHQFSLIGAKEYSNIANCFSKLLYGTIPVRVRDVKLRGVATNIDLFQDSNRNYRNLRIRADFSE